jgi:DNA-binding NarL/FixJ family response regulator
MIRVLIVEDHLMVRAGLRALLERAADVEIVGEASNGLEAVKLASSLKPDVVLMDIMMPRLNGIQAAERIRDLQLPIHVILLSMHADEGLVHQALLSGVRGYVLKTSVSDELLMAVRAASRGEMYLSASISSIVIGSSSHWKVGSPDEPLDTLSPREKEILQLIAEAHTSVEIAKMLFISEKTVEKHRSSLMEKLNIHNLAGLVRFAVKIGLVDRDC